MGITKEEAQKYFEETNKIIEESNKKILIEEKEKFKKFDDFNIFFNKTENILKKLYSVYKNEFNNDYSAFKKSLIIDLNNYKNYYLGRAEGTIKYNKQENKKCGDIEKKYHELIYFGEELDPIQYKLDKEKQKTFLGKADLIFEEIKSKAKNILDLKNKK